MLNKAYLKPLIKKFLGLFLSMILVGSIAFTLLFGCVNSYQNFNDSYDHYISNYGYPDIMLALKNNVEDDKINEISKLKEIDQIEKRYSFPFTTEINSRPVTLKCNTYTASSIIKYYTVEETNFTTEYINIDLERKFAINNNIKCGDIISVPILDKTYQVIVHRIVQTPETTLYRFSEMMIADCFDYGCCYLNLGQFIGGSISDELTEALTNVGCQLLVKSKTGTNNADLLQKLIDIADELNNTVIDSYTFETSKAVQETKDYLKTIRFDCVTIPSIFFLISLVITILFLMQMIKTQSRDIGIMMMLGINKKKLFGLFSLFSLVVSCISSIIGIIGGTILCLILKNAFLMDNIFPYINLSINVPLILLIIAINLFIGQIATLISFLTINKLSPQQIFTLNNRNNEKKHKFFNKLECRMPNKIQISNSVIFSNIKRLISSCFAYLACFVLIFMCLDFNQSLNKMLTTYTENRLNYDVQVISLDETSDIKDKVKTFDFVEKVEYSLVGNAQISYKDKTIESMIETFEENHEFVIIKDENDNNIPYYQDGIVLEQDIAKRLGASIGDFVTINSKQVEIKDISVMYSNKMQIMSKETIESLDIFTYETLLINTSDEIKLLNALKSNNYTTYSLFSRNLENRLKGQNKTYSFLSYALISFSIMISFVIILLMNESSFIEQKRNLSILRVNGFKIRDISALWFIQFGVQLAIGLIFGVPIGILLTKLILKNMSKEAFTYPFINSAYIYLIAIGIICAFYVIDHFLTIKSVKKFNIADNTRSRE